LRPRLRACDGEQFVESAPCVAEAPATILGRRMDLDSSTMVRDARRNTNVLASQTFAVGASVCLVMSGECLES
jgi:hypothetical protein